MLLGVPSPSLAKMNRMSAAELADHIDRLDNEIKALDAKIDRLEKIEPRPEDRIKTLNDQSSASTSCFGWPRNASAERIKPQGRRDHTQQNIPIRGTSRPGATAQVRVGPHGAPDTRTSAVAPARLAPWRTSKHQSALNVLPGP